MAISVLVYDEFSKKMILQFKNGDCTYMAPQFAMWMYRTASNQLKDMDMIIPVPMSLLKRIRRKYNQSELLAKQISKLANIPYEPDILYKRKGTRPQEGLTRGARLKNLSGAFDIYPKQAHLLQGKNIALIDDVITTGTTANECARILKKHGAKKVMVVTIARVTLEENVQAMDEP